MVRELMYLALGRNLMGQRILDQVETYVTAVIRYVTALIRGYDHRCLHCSKPSHGVTSCNRKKEEEKHTTPSSSTTSST